MHSRILLFFGTSGCFKDVLMVRQCQPCLLHFCCCCVLQCMHYSTRHREAELISMVTGWMTGHVRTDAMENCQFAAKPSKVVHLTVQSGFMTAHVQALDIFVPFDGSCFGSPTWGFVTVRWKGLMLCAGCMQGMLCWCVEKTEWQLQHQTTHSDSAHPFLLWSRCKWQCGSSFILFSFSLMSHNHTHDMHNLTIIPDSR